MPFPTRYVLTTIKSFQMRYLMEFSSHGASESTEVKSSKKWSRFGKPKFWLLVFLILLEKFFKQFLVWKLSIIVKKYLVGKGVVALLHKKHLSENYPFYLTQRPTVPRTCLSMHMKKIAEDHFLGLLNGMICNIKMQPNVLKFDISIKKEKITFLCIIICYND